MHNLFVVESRGKRVLTSAQIADCYDTTVDCIKQNFHANRNRFIEGKHYIALTGTELKAFKNEVRIPHSDEAQAENEVRIPHSAEIKVRYQFNTQFKYAKILYLWTEKGALLHAKSLNTDKAWQVYDYLVDFYFRAKEKEPEIPEKKEKVVYEAAYELAHYFIHYDQGDIINSSLQKDYDEQAERTAFMMIRMLDIKTKQNIK